jgi:hypothetical protein
MKHANVDQADIPLPRLKVGLLLPLSSTNEDEDSYTPLANYRLKSDPVVNDQSVRDLSSSFYTPPTHALSIFCVATRPFGIHLV